MCALSKGLAEILERAPLYSWRSLQLPDSTRDFFPDQMTLFCSKCGGERPFKEQHGSGSGTVYPQLKSDVYWFSIYCGFCYEKHYFFVEVDLDRSRIRKVGQSPPWNIEISRDLVGQLGEDAELFKRGRICLGQGYGLAACAYFRRVLESRVDKILELLQAHWELDGSTQKATEIRRIRRGKVADKKLERASALVPATLLIDGENPLKLLYELLSVGVHALPDDDCTSLAERLSEALSFVLLELSRAMSARERFAKNIKTLREVHTSKRESEG